MKLEFKVDNRLGRTKKFILLRKHLSLILRLLFKNQLPQINYDHSLTTLPSRCLKIQRDLTSLEVNMITLISLEEILSYLKRQQTKRLK